MYELFVGERGVVMAQLPECPNFREKNGHCSRSDLILAGETDTFYDFFCKTCGIKWVWTKPRTKQAAAYERDLARVRERTQKYREETERPVVFGAPKGGWM